MEKEGYGDVMKGIVWGLMEKGMEKFDEECE